VSRTKSFLELSRRLQSAVGDAMAGICLKYVI
jgi:hypothetical protein